MAFCNDRAAAARGSLDAVKRRLAASGLRAYYGSEEGVFFAARASTSEPFGEEVLLLDASLTGPIDGPIWVAPQEDVVFYCSGGPAKSPKPGDKDKARKLWMIRY